MDWGNFIFLLIILIIGYLPYKFLMRLLPKGLSDISKLTSLGLIAWFILFSAIIFIQVKNPQIQTDSTVLLIFIITTIVWILAPFVIPKIGVYPKEIAGQKPTWYSVQFKYHTFYLKYFEVLFQQSKFIFMLQLVLIGFTLIDRVILFTLIIGVFHLLNLYFLPKREAMVFFLFSIPMGGLFSLLIINGFLLLTISIHLWFYLIYSTLPWLNKNTIKVALNG